MNCSRPEMAEAYCAWAGGRLPTMYEFEKASRGTDGRRFPWGDEAPRCDVLQFDECEKGLGLHGPHTKRVGSFPEGVSPYGVLDLAGNVREIVTRPPSDEGPRREADGLYQRPRFEYHQVGGSYGTSVDMIRPWAPEYLDGDFSDARAGIRCVYDVEPLAGRPDPEPPPPSTPKRER